MPDRAVLHETISALEARLAAHRRVLGYLLARLGAEERAALVAAMAEPYPANDGQEDPGAVPTLGVGALNAFAAEMNAVLGR
jgi:hypothetical protein